MQNSANDYIVRTLRENWRREMEAALLYETAANGERDDRRRDILSRLAEVERTHARLWQDKLLQAGVAAADLTLPARPAKPGSLAQSLQQSDLLQQIETIEGGNAAWYESQRNVIEDPDFLRIIDQIDADEAAHGDVADTLFQPSPTAKRGLVAIWREERWHRQGQGSWVGDAIYGVNDGLGAIFGIIAGVAGYTNDNQTILISGIFGALASTLSMGAGAWLAAKSENELMETEIAREREEIESNPEHEVEELSLLYELKGFSGDESQGIARRIAQDPERMLRTMAQEELGIHEAGRSNPWRSAIFGSASTLVGGLVPLVPFFFLHGLTAVLAAAAVSIAAHFAVGAAKSLVTVRTWWASGLEMTAVGIMVGVVSYGLGLAGAALLG